jgi:hypothetical protein
MTHPVLLANDSWEEYEAEGARLQEKRASLADHELAAWRPFHEAMAEHPALLEQALESGESPPLRPPVPDTAHLADARRLLEHQEQEHRARRDQVLTAAAEDLLAGLHDRERADNAHGSVLAPQVRALVARRKEDRRLAADVYAAVDRTAGVNVRPSRSDRVPRDLDAGTLLDAAEADRTLLEPDQLLLPREPKILPDFDHRDGWTLRAGERAAAADQGVGFVNGGRFGNPPMPAGTNSNRGVEI